MKKTRFMAIVLVVAVMLMGAGYAVWTQEFTLEANVETGELDLDISLVSTDFDWYRYEDPNDTAQWVKNDDDYSLVAPDLTGVEVDDIEDISLDFSKLFPSATARMEFTIKNEGTVPAAIETVSLKTAFKDLEDNAWTGKELKNITARAVLVESDGNKLYSKDYSTDGLTGMSNTGEAIRHQLRRKHFEKALKAMLEDYEIKKGETVTLRLFVRVEDCAGNDTENKKVLNTLSIDFVQKNLVNSGL